MNSKKGKAAVLLALLACAPPAAAQEVLPVLSSGGGAYLEAYAAFRAASGVEAPYRDLSLRKPETGPETRVVAAFGGKAALAVYPPGVDVVYCMAPGIFLKTSPPRGKTVKISMIPAFGEIFSRIRLLQPSLKRLHIFWSAPGFATYMAALKAAAAEYGIETVPVLVEGGGALPPLLRARLGEIEAFWTLPDPLLLTRENLRVLREFSWGNSVPFYGSSRGVTREGAAASIGVSFKRAGETAAGAVRRLKAGEALPEVIFPEQSELTINATAADNCGLELSKEALSAAEQVFQ